MVQRSRKAPSRPKSDVSVVELPDEPERLVPGQGAVDGEKASPPSSRFDIVQDDPRLGWDFLAPLLDVSVHVKEAPIVWLEGSDRETALDAVGVTVAQPPSVLADQFFVRLAEAE